MSRLSSQIRRWVTIWAIGGLIAGSILALTDSGHVPAVLAPLVMAVVGGLAGLLGGFLFAGLARGSLARRAAGLRLVLGLVAGALAGVALSVLGIGITRIYCALTGVVLGAISALK